MSGCSIIINFIIIFSHNNVDLFPAGWENMQRHLGNKLLIEINLLLLVFSFRNGSSRLKRSKICYRFSVAKNLEQATTQKTKNRAKKSIQPRYYA
jgi:hypothetical protein